MVGDGPERAKAEQKCRELGMCNHVRFLGKQDQVEEVLSISDLFMIPSGSETFGLAALEAMSCSVPVISSNIGGLPEVNIQGETGYLCELADVECMGQRATEILTDEELHTRMANAARKRAEIFEMSKVITDYENYYEEVKRSMS